MNLSEADAYRHSITTRSGEISYLDMGQGPAALFVHGVGTNAYLWRHALQDLADGQRCIAIDLPLHGRTTARADQDLSLAGLASVVEDFCDALDLDKIDLVANDTGGAVAQMFAVSFTHRLRTFTLTNCDVHDNLPPEPFRPTVELAQRGELAPFAVQLAANPELARTKGIFSESFQYPERLSDEEVRAYLEPAFGTESAARRFEHLLRSLTREDLMAIKPQLQELEVPTLLVWGTDDESFPLRWAHWLQDVIPGVVGLVEVEGGRLFFPAERPAELTGPLREHWTTAHTARAQRA
jgi:pimeloyl-ACP methyl ester carboxylesterase